MKALLLAAGLVLLPAVASAGTLVAGAVRDTDGYAVPGATLAVVTADGRVVGRGTTAGDGTFAIDADGVPATLEVRCRFCTPQHVRLTGAPPAIVVVRFAALRDRTPSTDDIAALPYDRAATIAALVPYAVVTNYGVSDRGLNDARGATFVDGIPAYRITDGRDLLDLVPLDSTASLTAQPAGFAPLYGAPANGGTFDFGTLGPTGLAATGGGTSAAAALRFTNPSVRAAYDESIAPFVVRRATGELVAPLLGGSFSALATAAGSSFDNEAGVALQYATSLSHFDAIASFAAADSRSNVPAGTTADDVRADLHVQGHGPSAATLGIRLQEATGNDGPTELSGAQGATAVYAAARSTGSATTVIAAVSLEHDTETLAGPARWDTTALLPALSAEYRLGDGFAVRASTTAALAEPYLQQLSRFAYPVTPFVRTNVVDAALTYSDDRRLRVDGIVYAQRAGDATNQISGLGLDAAWQVTPQLALRSWALAAAAGADEGAPPADAYQYPPTGTPVRRQVLWITYHNGVRVDMLTHGAGIDGSVSVPFGRSFTLVAGTVAKAPGRVVTLRLKINAF